jgi:hypothetical protein
MTPLPGALSATPSVATEPPAAQDAHQAAAAPRALRLATTFSVALLALLAVATLASPILVPVLRPQQTREALPQVGKLQLLERPDEWILQYDLTNHRDEPAAYTFTVTYGSKTDTHSAFLRARDTFSYIYHFYPEQTPARQARFTVHRAAEADPVEDVTLHLSRTSAGAGSGASTRSS